MENIDWENLSFGYNKTDYNVKCIYKNGKWGELEVSSSEYITIHMASTVIHYGQGSFEGMKAFQGKDGKIRLFRWDENAKRMEDSAEGIVMPKVPREIFKDAIFKTIKLNIKYTPPYGTGASLYIRPFLFGLGPELGVKHAKDYMFMVFVSPVGPYFKTGFKPIKIAIERDTDRAAPMGTGHLKIGGNYAASLASIKKVQEAGYSSPLYLDSKEKKYIDEIGAANFFGIKNNTYVTPDSHSILPSITNKSTEQLAKNIGMKVERRPVAIDELDSFEEVGACGTAAIITPISEIFDMETGQKYLYCKDGKPGKISTLLYNKLQAIQYGDEPDPHNWIEIVE